MHDKETLCCGQTNYSPFSLFSFSFSIFLILSPVLLNFCQFRRTFNPTGEPVRECALSPSERAGEVDLFASERLAESSHGSSHAARGEHAARPAILAGAIAPHLPSHREQRGRPPRPRPRRAWRHHGSHSPRRGGTRRRRRWRCRFAAPPSVRLQGARGGVHAHPASQPQPRPTPRASRMAGAAAPAAHPRAL